MEACLLKKLICFLQKNFEEFFEELLKITSEENYIKRAKEENEIYYNEFKDIIYLIYLKEFDVSNKKRRKFITSFLKHKFMLGDSNFNKNQFIQSASELSVINFFMKKYKDSFEYEPKNASKNLSECKIKYKNNIFNIEVKCPTIQEIKSLKTVAYHRQSEKKMKDFIENINEKKTDFIKEVKRREETLYDFLVGADSKFLGESDGTEVNVLFVCLDKSISFDFWEVYLNREEYSYFGIRPEHINSKYNDGLKQSYEKVDLVVFTNLFNSHYYNFKERILNPWNLEEHFNIIYTNPHRKIQNKKNIEGIILFRYEILKNVNVELKRFMEKTLYRKKYLFLPTIIWQLDQNFKSIGKKYFVDLED